MALNVGDRPGRYDVTALLGEGGMGQVWQATDTQLNRQVALKILPDAFADDPDRLARFTREAQILASLNHPNIAAIHGIEEADGTRALVLELVEGPTLADRIAKGPIPIDEALPIAKQIAEALELEAAHEAGVIHRDLKPANIKVRDDGTVKVLDFGLAKAFAPETGGDPSQSPTLTAAATQQGVILGTAAYMSPEQASGATVDKRADIWSFGVVLFEMLTGTRAFDGETVSHVLAAVLKTEPEWLALPPETPGAIKKLLRRCLAKERRKRVPDIGMARFEIDDAVGDDSQAAVSMHVPRRQSSLAWGLATVCAALAVTFGALYLNRSPSEAATVRFSEFAPDGGTIAAVALSPDGSQLAYVSFLQGRGRLWVRALDSVDARPLPGTEGGDDPFWSADGRMIGFHTTTETKIIDPSGGPPQTVFASGGRGRALTWNDDDVILSYGTAGILQVPATGGDPTPVTTVDAGRGEVAHTRPEFLPGGKQFLFLVHGGEQSGIYVGSLAPGTTPSFLLRTNRMARYSSPGYLLFGRDDTLMAQPFDVEQLALTGNPVLVAEGVVSNPNGWMDFSTSRRGDLTYGCRSRTDCSVNSLTGERHDVFRW